MDEVVERVGGLEAALEMFILNTAGARGEWTP